MLPSSYNAKREVADEALHASGKLRLEVSTNGRGFSMLPSLWPGDILLIEQTGFADLQPGDLVLYSSEGRFVVHRILKKEEQAVITRGDARTECDDPVPAASVHGRVASIERGAFRFVPRGKLSWAQKVLVALIRRHGTFRSALLRWNAFRVRLRPS